MSHTALTSRPSWRKVAARGAEIGIALDFAYAATFIVYAILRSTAKLLETPGIDAGWPGTALATWTALALPAFVFAVLFVPIVALLGALTALAVYALSPTLNPEHAPGRAVFIGIGVCSLVVFATALLLDLQAGLRWTPALAETLTFWLALPLLIYIVAGGVASRHLNHTVFHG